MVMLLFNSMIMVQ